MSDAAVTLDIDRRGVATVTLRRAEKHNAFDDRVIRELDHAFSSCAANDDVRILVLAAAGRSFSAGADLGWMQRMASYSHGENLADARALAGMLCKLNQLPQPTIARVQGAAYGGAVGLVACCDLALGSEQARFCLSEVRLGLIPATISPYLIAAVGQRAARRYFMTAEVIDADRALHLGLLSHRCSAAGMDNRLRQIIDNLLANGPQATRAGKRLVLDYANRFVDDELVEDSCRRIADSRVSAEGQAGLKAFLEKRNSPWNPQDV